MSKIVQEFKEFILRGNVVELAVAVVIGAAFGNVVSSLNDGLVTPLVGMLGGTDFSDQTFEINNSVFSYGLVINAVINFVMISAAVFFIIVKPANVLMARMKREVVEEDSSPETPADVALLTEIRDLLRSERAS